MLSLIRTFLGTFSGGKTFLTSRREPDLVEAFEKMTAPTIEIEAKSVAADISKVCFRRDQDSAWWSRW